MFRRRWTVKEKLRLIRETEGLTLQAASDQFGVSPSVLCGWRLSKDKLQERFESDKENVPCRLKGAGRPSKIDIVTQQELLLFLDVEREKTNRVDVPSLLVKLRQIDPLVDREIDISNGSVAVRAKIRKQIWRILRKNNIGTRRTTHQSQNTRLDQEMMDGFNAYLKEKMQMLMIDHDSIASFDETNTYFSPSSATTLDRKGNKTVAVRTPGSSQRCSVMLGVTGEGKPFQPYLIFKGKYGPTGHIYRLFQRIYEEQEIMRNDPTHLPGRVFGRYATRCYYSVQENTWNDSVHMLEWIKYANGLKQKTNQRC